MLIMMLLGKRLRRRKYAGRCIDDGIQHGEKCIDYCNCNSILYSAQEIMYVHSWIDSMAPIVLQMIKHCVVVGQ